MRHLRKASAALTLLVAVVATCGCGPSEQTETETQTPERSTSIAIPQSETGKAGAVENEAADEPTTSEQVTNDVQVQLAAVQAERGELLVERDRIARLLASHQAEGEQRLATLKKQWTAFDGGSATSSDQALTRERFAERARVEMENALMMDQEYRAQLQETENRLEQAEQRMHELRERTTQ